MITFCIVSLFLISYFMIVQSRGRPLISTFIRLPLTHSEDLKNGSQHVNYSIILDDCLEMVIPFPPSVTEEIYETHFS